MTLVERVSRAICQERCAYMGEPPCWQVVPDDWPNSECNEPGCHALALAAIFALRDRRMSVNRDDLPSD